ncbi:hypothetical protein ASF22_18440 [Methylobacterium sp. Leaf87]|uniref:DUF4238 domain-containing protein n=1 Tax=Methylobacterium sp. Leaf87 TaxID=1736243 RepID=UPI0006FF3A55|nr:DUF4238 domain-containing protein [Methylobacterium sp. Leaf87]KQO69144.1 hypothetical protein ASF22_18440 [Methylobacterium sp. Leaf87]
MSITRNNHYIPQWYQEGFFENSRNKLAYLDLKPPQKKLDDGRLISQRALFDAPTSRAFVERDLYSTFFGTSVNDEIERGLFGQIDTTGSKAVRAFVEADVSGWMRHFKHFFEYIDIQKIRTPKGLNWLRMQYPELSQNELMFEMQGIRMMHCTIWTEGVREIVSAEDADVKFIVSDHPVTVYNHAVPPEAGKIDPGITLKGSQTIFPLNKDFCLILTNLEYARDPAVNALEKRTFARNFRNSMVKTDAFIRTRKLTGSEVAQVNFVLKTRACRYIAAGRKEWLYPERTATVSWTDIRKTLLPPNAGLWHFGGEMFAKFDSGHVHYQDEFGRTEKKRDFLQKVPPTTLRPRDACPCGSWLSFKACCQPKAISLRPEWTEKSIRERNVMLLNGIVKVLNLREEPDWVEVRRALTDEKISKIYSLFEALWPLETDLLRLLPKPDGTPRAVYTGAIHPSMIAEFALAAPLYFGELLIEHPFLHAGTVRKEFSPIENPLRYRGEFLKSVSLFLKLMPLVERRLINLVPDPGNFDPHLRRQVMQMAEMRAAEIMVRKGQDTCLEKLMSDDLRRNLMALPKEYLRRQLAKISPELNGDKLEEMLREVEVLKENDPLAVLHTNDVIGEKGGQFSLMKLAPNFEMTMYLAQAIGASIVTDSPFRYQEIKGAIRRRAGHAAAALTTLSDEIERSVFLFPQESLFVAQLAAEGGFDGFPATMSESFKYLATLPERGTRPNVERRLAAQLGRAQSNAQRLLRGSEVPATLGRVKCVFPGGGIQDHTINRLLLMSNSEHHMSQVPMAFFIQRP